MTEEEKKKLNPEKKCVPLPQIPLIRPIDFMSPLSYYKIS